MFQHIRISGRRFYTTIQRKSTSGTIRIAAVLILIVVAGGSIGTSILVRAHAAGCSNPYTVQFGDTLGAIANRFGTTVGTIASENGIPNVDLIFPGQQLCLYAETTSLSLPQQVPSTTNVQAIITDVFGSFAPAAERVASCESSLNPMATNSISINGSHASGLFQILYPSTWSTTSQAAASPYNARANAQAAYEIFARDGYRWSEWVCQP